jgi:hypothetical protein
MSGFQSKKKMAQDRFKEDQVKLINVVLGIFFSFILLGILAAVI